MAEVFKTWKNYDEYLVLKAENQLTDEIKYFAVKCSKRGNDVFASRLNRKLGFLRSDEVFFNSELFDKREGHKVKTRLLWVTLTYDSKRCSLNEAWKNIGSEFNLWITNLRNHFGKISYVCFPQAFPSESGLAHGYPHFHVIMFFGECEFSVFRRMERNRNRELSLVFRIQEKEVIHSQGKWHSWIDVKALSSMKAVWNYAKKHSFNAGYGSSDEATLNNSVMWLFRKRSFNMSGDFRIRYLDLIRSMRNSKSILQSRLVGESFPIWKFVLLGIYSVFDLCIKEKTPPWSILLTKEEVSNLVSY